MEFADPSEAEALRAEMCARLVLCGGAGHHLARLAEILHPRSAENPCAS